MKISEMTLAEVKFLLAEQGTSLAGDVRISLSLDNRVGVQKLYQQLCRQEALEVQEEIRLKKLQFYEEDVRRRGYLLVAGIDEAGRGPLAGPVLAAAAVLPADVRIRGINDSKKLSSTKRDELYHEIISKAVAWSVGMSTVEEIDSLNILQASLLAMRRAVQGLNACPDYLLVDAVKIPEITIPQLAIIKGDGLSVSIAAASIIAKVTRDKIMNDLDREYPRYGFGRHKGYGTTEHINALREYGPSLHHRRTFIKNL
ncbi:MAG TPA: ribonuclease HII [Desulfobacteria bacterium]|nr:ribonuclease HII [Desulfobacteria bacterium]